MRSEKVRTLISVWSREPTPGRPSGSSWRTESQPATSGPNPLFGMSLASCATASKLAGQAAHGMSFKITASKEPSSAKETDLNRGRLEDPAELVGRHVERPHRLVANTLPSRGRAKSAM